jgi:heptosyltransferase II
MAPVEHLKTLIIKLGASGDVVRTTPLLRRLRGSVTWITESRNKALLEGARENGRLRVTPWEDRSAIAREFFDLVINLEDQPEVARLVSSLNTGRVFGPHLNCDGRLSYSLDSSRWFDLSIISVYGKQRADVLKALNRTTYQGLLFGALNLEFRDDRYILPPTAASTLRGDVAISPEAGPVWPMKAWAHYPRLKADLESHGLKVNFLPMRRTLLEHLADIRGHSCVVSGDSLPMHLAMGSGVECVALFNCTSPWEIHDYGVLRKVISPLLEEFFYKRAFDPRAITAISYDEVRKVTLEALESRPLKRKYQSSNSSIDTELRWSLQACGSQRTLRN